MSIRVALVDDQELVRTGLAMVIDACDDMRVVAQAGDGAQALDELSRHTADIVLMDVQMPQLDGIETTKRIRACEAGQPGRPTPILALTANALVEDRYACFEAGMDGFLIKPLDRDKLADALASLAAARYLSANVKRLTKVYGKRGDFCLVLGLRETATFGADQVELIADVTAHAFAPDPDNDARAAAERFAPVAHLRNVRRADASRLVRIVDGAERLDETLRVVAAAAGRLEAPLAERAGRLAGDLHGIASRESELRRAVSEADARALAAERRAGGRSGDAVPGRLAELRLEAEDLSERALEAGQAAEEAAEASGRL